MQSINNQLFTEVTNEESASVSGGIASVAFGLDTYLFVLGAGLQFGNPGITPDEIQFAFENAVFATESFSPGFPLPLRLG